MLMRGTGTSADGKVGKRGLGAAVAGRACQRCDDGNTRNGLETRAFRGTLLLGAVEELLERDVATLSWSVRPACRASDAPKSKAFVFGICPPSVGMPAAAPL